MLKKTITYTDFDNNERTETHWFNLNRTELTEIALGLPDGLTENEITEVNEKAALSVIDQLGRDGVFKFIKELMLKSYGKKSADGKRFEKSEELSKEFSETLAFDQMFMELMSDDVAAAEFVKGVIPGNIASELPANN